MLVSESHGFIFIHIGKTGGTSIERALCEYLDLDFEITKKDTDGQWWKHIWAKGMRRRIGPEAWNSHFTFAFVRNPYDMVLSLYSMYTQYLEYTNVERHPDLYHPWNQYDDFEHFIISMGRRSYDSDSNWRRQLAKLGARSQHQVWESLRNLQTSYLTESWKGMDGPGEILVKFVGRFEHLQADFDKVCDHIGIPRLELPSVGGTHHPPFDEIYTPSMADIVRAHFDIDIRRFGYPPPRSVQPSV